MENQINETAKAPKAKAQVIKETAKAKAQVIKETAKAKAKAQVIKETAKAKAIKETAKAQETSLIENVISHREVKYIYPKDVVDTLSRKTWRQKVRNKLHQLELTLSRIKDANSEEYQVAFKEFQEFKKQVLKPEQIA